MNHTKLFLFFIQSGDPPSQLLWRDRSAVAKAMAGQATMDKKNYISVLSVAKLMVPACPG